MPTETASLLDPIVQQCPFPLYAKLREEEPVRFMPELGVFFVSNYALGRKILIDSKRFAKKTAENDGRRYVEPSKAAQEILRTKDVGTPISLMAQKEGAEHRAYRGIVERYFQSGTVRSMEAYIEETATELLDRLSGRDELEVVSEFAVPLPVYVIADVLGIPKANYLDFKRWSDAVLTYTALVVPEDQAIAGAESMVEMHRYMLSEVHSRRLAPRDDLLNVLAHAEYEGRLLTDREICGFTDEILVAGNETTTSAISAGLLHLAQHPDQQQLLRAKPELISKFAEEVLRVSTPLQVALRYALVDTKIGDVDVPAHSKIFVGIGSANLDDCAFASADQIDPTRGNAKSHVAFGAGEHHCLGAELARLELRTAFRLWLNRYSETTLAQELASVTYPSSYAVRGPLAVRLRVTAA